MRDFPVFTTENGVGSLVLKEIPYSGIAYVTIHDSSDPTEFLEECLGFCKAVGAQAVYACGHEVLENYPYYMSVVQMSVAADLIPESNAFLFPVTEPTLSRWCEIYNNKMKHIDNASYMSERAAKEMLKRGDGYFVHRDGNLLGIGIASGERLECVASVAPGGGREIVSTLVHALLGDCAILEVASTNSKAISLYESMGFIKTAEISRWYKIF